jgi:predicted SAM-dependent methyltransferase
MKKLTQCPVCDSSSTEEYMKCKDHSKSQEYFKLEKCINCSFIFTNPRPEEKDLGKYYEFEEYVSHSDTTKDLINKLYHIVRKWNVRNKVKYLGKEKGIVLEIGSGTAEVLSKCKRKGWQTIGVEPSKSARYIAHKNHGILLNKNIDECELKEKSVDRIMMWHVLEHITNLDEVMNLVKNTLKEEGEFIIAMPNSNSLDAQKYKENWAGYDVPRHVSHFQKNTVKRLVEKHGFEIVKPKPMWFDSFYTSMLSEKIKTGKYNYIKASWTGLRSNIKAVMRNGEFSSLIYFIRLKKGF